MEDSRAPRGAAWREDGQLVIQCPYCDGEHRHGTGGPKRGDGDGYRVSHCSVAVGGSYYVVES
ncbi:hypothetical protein GCM10023082_26440 [Streptomyces tremellae]|uniref:Uncharacterized protein n=1 Tax=Streptomyces tremellae TaxID=1124239 RepID=A0ABP7F0P0_9ACTN